MNIWRFSRLVSSRLLRWGVISVVAGLFIQRHRDPVWRGIGTQSLGWGFIDALIALFGGISTQNKIASLLNPGEIAAQYKEKTNLKKLLWVNTILDAFYVIGGLWMVRSDKGNGIRRGHGLGIIIQGGFLLVFDTLHAILIEEVEPRDA